MVATRQFGACFLVMLATGALLLATTQFLPELVQEDFGYTATWAGVMVSPGGVVRHGDDVRRRPSGGQDPAEIPDRRWGGGHRGVDVYALTNVYGDLGFWFMARSRMLFSAAFPLMFIPITAASYDGIPPDKTGQASALINAARNTGGSIGISLISNVLWRREQFHQNMLVDQALPSSVQYQDTLHQMTT
jgi:MFS transporter, DHA2 family, multidrug resistance protein